jgi:secreted trypsin-like serine protease
VCRRLARGLLSAFEMTQQHLPSVSARGAAPLPGLAKDLVLRGFAALFALGLVASACGGGGGDVAEETDAIIGGRVDRVHTAVGQLGSVPTAASSDVSWHCTATLVGPSTVLTAAHCVVSASGRTMSARRLRFAAGDEIWRGARVHVPWGYAPDTDGPWDDLALVELTRSVEGVEPMHMATESDRAPEPGDVVRVIGFGVTRATGAGTGVGGGTRRRATVELSWVGARELEYVFDGQGACFGDSGGPLVHTSRGEERVVGVTSRGSDTDCRGFDVATRVDAFEPWLAELADLGDQ